MRSSVESGRTIHRGERRLAVEYRMAYALRQPLGPRKQPVARQLHATSKTKHAPEHGQYCIRTVDEQHYVEVRQIPTMVFRDRSERPNVWYRARVVSSYVRCWKISWVAG